MQSKVIQCPDDDRFQREAWKISAKGMRCIGVENDKFSFTKLGRDKQHILVTATADNYHFVRPVINLMRNDGHYVTELSMKGLQPVQLMNAMRHCDIAWFEWGDGAIVAASKMPKYCHIICRIHAYELYQSEFLQVNWLNVDEVVVVSEAMKSRFISQLGDNYPAHLKVTVLANLTTHQPAVTSAVERNDFDLACVTRFIAKKNVMQLLLVMKALRQRSPEYRLFIAGRVEDTCLYESFCQLIEVYGLQDNIVLCGQIAEEKMQEWYQSKRYLLSTSSHESQGMGIFEAMLAGLKPVVFPAAGGLCEYLPEKYLVFSVDEAVAQITSEEYTPDLYQQDARTALQQDVLRDKYRQLWALADAGNIKISIVIPCYNREKYILSAVYSALLQRDTHFEVIVVDDGSTDNSLALLSSINQPNFRLIEKQHTNAPDTRNRGVAESSGEFIVWLDSDDILHPNALSHYRTLLKRWPQTDIISCAMETIGENKRYFASYNHSPASWLHQLPKGNVIANPGSCVRRNLYHDVGGYHSSYPRAHDYEFWSRAMGNAALVFTAQCNILYRLHDDNLSGLGTNVDQTYELKIFNAVLKRYPARLLFPGFSATQVSEFIALRRKVLMKACCIDNLAIFINALGQSSQQIVRALAFLRDQQDKAFRLIFVSENAMDFPGQTVLVMDKLEPAQLRRYLAESSPDKYYRGYLLDIIEAELVDRQAIRKLKSAILDDELVSPSCFVKIR